MYENMSIVSVQQNNLKPGDFWNQPNDDFIVLSTGHNCQVKVFKLSLLIILGLNHLLKCTGVVLSIKNSFEVTVS